jgi:hypothetical protein
MTLAWINDKHKNGSYRTNALTLTLSQREREQEKDEE